MRRRILGRKIPRKRFLLHFPCLWTSMLTEDYLRYIEGLRHCPELSPLRSRQASVSNSPRSQLIDSLPVITLRVMISLEFGNRHCRETCVCEVRPGKTVIDRSLESVRKCGVSIVGTVDGVENWGVTENMQMLSKHYKKNTHLTTFEK
ncbi:hypothetical protein PIB30_014790 [Stylosanthes scabra]|uniref:Uncharacterized protein n=1 Tax=Stylosanthes scabra TaxID=79078 RepID=A0ABU6Z7A4_9FABA|nr:hypothetical protein [Stylosanthes scabra]